MGVGRKELDRLRQADRRELKFGRRAKKATRVVVSEGGKGRGKVLCLLGVGCSSKISFLSTI